ncbi:MAG: cyclic nucleotide-binding domain-containing protein [Bacteroidales bacterium]|jgi:CRP-like cAMP-binding protein|nr:cyclic nucleotide-binding domain-containing protein [Bacteroidales bacterium]
MKPQIEDFKNVRFFENTSDKHLKMIAKISTIKKFKVEEILFEQYNELSELYVLVEGSLSLGIKLPTAKKIHLSNIEEGQLFSWTALFYPYISTAWVKAIKPVKVIAIDAKKLKEVINNASNLNDCEFGFKFMEKIVQTISHRLNDTRFQLMNQLSI